MLFSPYFLDAIPDVLKIQYCIWMCLRGGQCRSWLSTCRHDVIRLLCPIRNARWPAYILCFGDKTHTITVAAPCKAWTVFVRSNTEIVGSYPTRGVEAYVCFFCICVVLCVGRSLTTGWFLVQGVQPTVYGSRTWKSGQGSQCLYIRR
jgi:hypothetical protein